jgi:hypothetical protein
MALPASGQISFNDIQTELGLNIGGQNAIGDFISYFPSMNQSTPYGMNEFYSQTYNNATTNGGPVISFGSSTPYTKSGTLVVKGTVYINWKASGGSNVGNSVTGILEINGGSYSVTGGRFQTITYTPLITLTTGSYPYTFYPSSQSGTNWTLTMAFTYP